MRKKTPLIPCRAILFDLDGVLVDSRRCIELVWEDWAAMHGRDARSIVAVAHGRRISETLREVAPDLDIAAEVAWLDRREEQETRGLLPVPGAADLLVSIPADRWAVVTSCSPAVASLRLGAAAVPTPSLLVTAADVARGKPAPDAYLLAAERLSIAPEECLVIEDSAAGVAAGVAAGMAVIAVEGTTDPSRLRQATVVVPALGSLRVNVDGRYGPAAGPSRLRVSWV